MDFLVYQVQNNNNWTKFFSAKSIGQICQLGYKKTRMGSCHEQCMGKIRMVVRWYYDYRFQSLHLPPRLIAPHPKVLIRVTK